MINKIYNHNNNYLTRNEAKTRHRGPYTIVNNVVGIVRREKTANSNIRERTEKMNILWLKKRVHQT